MLLELIGFTSVIFLLLVEIKRLYLSFCLRRIAGPPEIPFIGCKYILMTNKITDIESLCYEVCTEKTIKFFVLHRLVIVTNDADKLKLILTDKSCFDRPYIFDFLDLNYGLTSSKFNFWRPLRKGLNCTFNQQVINSLIPTFDKNYKIITNELDKYINEKPFDVHEVISKAIFASISETIFHQVIDGDFGPHELEELEDIVCQRIINAPLHLNLIYKMTSLYKRDQQIRHAIYSSLQKFITKKRSEIFKNDDIETSKNVLDKLVTMKVNGKPLSDIQIIENLANILVGGFETTASALGYCLLALAMHPHIQEKCFDELIKIFPDKKMDLTAKNIKKLTYLDMVIKETMRLFPPIPVSARQNMSDLDVGDFILPKDTILVLNIFKLHRDPDLWGEDCLQFNPEHFSLENVEKRHIYAFLPFTAGSRNCIGGRYALTSLKVGLAHILRHYKFSTPLKMNDLVFKLSITLKITNGFMVQLSKRTRDEHV